jgi:hypothetical protein
MKTAAASEDSSRVVDAELNSFLYKNGLCAGTALDRGPDARLD